MRLLDKIAIICYNLQSKVQKVKNMSEPLPPNQNDHQAWRRELEPHYESSGTLKNDEILALMGSWVEEGFESVTELHESGAMSDIEYSVQKRINEAALSELAILDIEGQNVYSAVAERQKVLEEQLDEKGANRLMVRAKLDGLRMLENTYKNIEDHVGPISRDRRVRAAAINGLIDNHNAWVSRTKEVGADTPEVLEAQERIDSRYAEQEERSQPTVTVDDARQEVAESFGDTGEDERQALINEVIQAAKGATRIHTDIPKGLMLKSSSGDYLPVDGFNSFGDGLPQSNRHHAEKLEYAGSAEAFLFEPDTTTRYKTVTKNTETGGRFVKKTKQVAQQIPDGEIQTMVVNPATGQQEPGIKVAYQFNGSSRRGNGQTAFYEGLAYMTESNRSGNQLFVEATLPKSVADKLRQGVVDNPVLARVFAKTLALNNGITEQAWRNGVRPPYDQTPKDWEMTIADLQRNTQFGDVQHNVVSQRVVQVPH